MYKADVCSKKFFSKKKFDYLITLNFLSFVDIKKQIFFLRSAKKISNKIILIENSYQRKLKRKKHFYDSLMKEKFKIFRKKIYHPDKIVCLFYYNFDK